MCWYSSEELSPEISKEDILIFKICKKSYDDKHVESKYQHFTYELGKLYTEDVKPYISSEDSLGFRINKAFHSYDMNLKIISWAMMGSNEILVEGIIPKGATYYLNMFGEIASNQIILKKIKK